MWVSSELSHRRNMLKFQLFFWISQKQTPWQEFKCKSVIWEVTLGITRKGVRKGDKQGKTGL